MKPLTDKCPMPFGKHKGTPMQDVPAQYLHYLWTNGMREENPTRPVGDYIRRSIPALKKELGDAIWT